MAKVFFEDKFMKYQKDLLLRNTLNNILYNEFIAGRTAYEHNFMLIGIFMQIIVFYITGDSVISLISGISGIISVILCSQKKFSFYIFGFIQLGTYMFLAYQQRFYGELVENIFYIVTMFIGMYIWLKNFNKKEQIVKTKKLSYKQLNIISILTFMGIFGLWKYLYITNDTQPFMDAVSTVPAFVAQILLMLCYREQWIFWIIIDVASVFMWAIADNWVMVVQYIFWTLNCIYGYKKW
ncbi:MAG: PnuC-like nicotinamide mononucleotide transport [Hatfieldvirus porci]|uniref:PnuC-like nicotinamide mononucleotide transport n=1 Tax=phage Lak_Megaphage_RVC_JS4_GC31 TaxID=3109228 RepID=A0ABZ0Z459_9CAUD|nr:MAG: PnuC-like nicotinamide mononucleotide transport [phage Lak_Megaphage_RVC_AP3_GC31]WQJ52992.1 MAG: PnuC-like nicotinamide mononucleotide transport [phage Lak_Megaphage_RVC_JS4_GC31]